MLKLTDPTYYDNQEIIIGQELKDEAKTKKELSTIMLELYASERYDKEEIREKMENVPDNFEGNCKYLTSLIFNEYNS